MLDYAENVPVHPLAARIRDRAVQRVCALIDCNMDDDVSKLVDSLYNLRTTCACMLKLLAKGSRN